MPDMKLNRLAVIVEQAAYKREFRDLVLKKVRAEPLLAVAEMVEANPADLCLTPDTIHTLVDALERFYVHYDTQGERGVVHAVIDAALTSPKLTPPHLPPTGEDKHSVCIFRLSASTIAGIEAHGTDGRIVELKMLPTLDRLDLDRLASGVLGAVAERAPMGLPVVLPEVELALSQGQLDLAGLATFDAVAQSRSRVRVLGPGR